MQELGLLSIVMRYGPYGQGPIPSRGKKYSPGLKRPGSEADHSPSSTKVKNGGAMPPFFDTSSWHVA
jgi:hypothetical protein